MTNARQPQTAVAIKRRAALKGVFTGALLLAAAWQLGNGGWVWAKALLAQQLLQAAWQKTLVSGDPQRPWPWADTFPSARLRVPSLDVDQIVLAGDSGRTLAFGPGYNQNSARLGEPGLTLVSGHRDTHFAFLQYLRHGDRIHVQSVQRQLDYRVTDMGIIDSRQGPIEDRHRHGLLLVTCYPFAALDPGGPLRYWVWAEPEAPLPASSTDSPNGPPARLL